MAKRRGQKPKSVEPVIQVKGVRAIQIHTPHFVQIDNADCAFNSTEVKGAFVKVCPTLSAERKEAFDANDIRAKLREAGARAVIIAPKFVSETKRVRIEKAEKASPREAVSAWFEDQTFKDRDKAKAIDLVFAFMDSEGM